MNTQLLNELTLIKRQFTEFSKLINEFGLDHFDSPLYRDMDILLTKLRERHKDLMDRLNLERV